MYSKPDVSYIFYRNLLHKVFISLIAHVYAQTYISLASSLFCAAIVFVALFSGENKDALFLWATFFLSVIILRVILVYMCKKQVLEKKINLWRSLYIFGALLGGLSWGLAGIILFPYAKDVQQILMVLMLAGVTAGAVPVLAGIPMAAITFLLSSILPFIFSIFLYKNSIYQLFDLALTLYLFYTIALSIKTHHLIRNSIILKFENDVLLNNLEINNKKLEEIATHDPLTQVANRILFQSNIEEAIKRALINKKKLALLYLDLDRFKSVNDRYGHEAGDYLLLTVVNRLKKILGTDQIISRLGGDELVIIIENIRDITNIEMVSEKICQSIAMPIKMDSICFHTSTSIGISIYPDDARDAKSLLKVADMRMYYVKARGGNSFYYRETVS